MQVTTIGIDLAKEVFQVHGVDGSEKVVLRKQLKRSQVSAFFSVLSPCLIGMEACGGAHHWARTLSAYGHTVKLMAPQFVKPYVKSNKNDMRDAEAICEAVTRPTMRFVPIKSKEQQAVLSLHRGREAFKDMRTSLANRIRGLLQEFGISFSTGISHVFKNAPLLLEERADDLPAPFIQLIGCLFDQFKDVDLQVKKLEKEIKRLSNKNEACKRLEEIPGVGPLTSSALVSTIGSAQDFKNGRELSAWLGLVPRQHSTGGKTVLGRISKRGDGYLRKLLIHGARSALLQIERKESGGQIKNLIQRSNKNVAAVALSNKNVRTIWALLAHNREYRHDYEEIRKYAKA